MTYLQKMAEKRSQLIKDYSSVIEAGKTEERSLTSDETAKLAEIKTKIDDIDETIDAEKRSIELKEKLADVPIEKADEQVSDEKRAFNVYLNTGKYEKRADTDPLNPTQDAAIAPDYFSTEVISEVKNKTMIYPLVKEIVVNNANISIPFFTDFSDAAFTTVIQDTDTATDVVGGFSKVEIAPLPLVKRVSISDLLIKTSSINIESYIRDAFIQMYSRVLDNAILNGVGTTEPLGLFKDSTIASSSTAGATIHPDDLIELVFDMLGKFEANDLTMIINPSVFKTVATTKGDAYLVKQWLNAGSIEGVKILYSGFAPTTVTAESPVAVIGNMQSYGVGRVDALELEREKNNKRGLVDFYGRLYVNGKTVNASAFKVLKIKAASTG